PSAAAVSLRGGLSCLCFAVAVAQLVEPRVVVPVVGGSSPLRHPSCSGRRPPAGGEAALQRPPRDADGTGLSGPVPIKHCALRPPTASAAPEHEEWSGTLT